MSRAFYASELTVTAASRRARVRKRRPIRGRSKTRRGLIVAWFSARTDDSAPKAEGPRREPVRGRLRWFRR